MPVAVLLGCIAGLLGVTVLAVAIGRSAAGTPAVYGLSLVLSLLALVTALAQLVAGSVAPELVLPLGLPWLGAHFRIDALSAFFLVVINLGAAAASLYAIGYGRHETAPLRVLPFFPAFLGAMNLVILADDAFSFLLSWEFMSLTSWALVMAHHRDPENVRAGYIYLLLASFGTLSLLLAFGLLAGPEGGYGFAAIRGATPSTLIAALVLGLVLLGAGSKSGLVPLHVWLPLAHPAAPSHVSALMSGVMTKVAIYGFVRIVFDLLGEPAWWWGMAPMLLGAGSAVLGLLYALWQTDLKRMLAYSTVENVGVVYVGLGLALAFQANGMDWAAALALTAALFHVLNHALFKSLLFFGAGAVLSATHERNMERLGGLIHRMKTTSFLVLVGCAAISALPPLNGFVSEWLIFQAILQSPALPQWGLKIMVPAAGALLALSAALAAACFVRAYGITFLGRPRSAAASEAREVDRFSLAAMALLAGLCLAVGIFPGLVIDALAPLMQLLVGDRMPAQAQVPWLSIVPIAESRSSYNGLLVFVFVLISASLAIFAIHRLASRVVRRAPAWDCGFPDPNPATQYTGGSFAQPIRRVFGTLLFRARETVDMPPPGDLRPARLDLELRDLVWDALYAPVAGAVGYAADRLNLLQFLTIRRYLGLVFMALVSLLMVLAIWS
jgi:formate hydrogenlyase subunit 3/multisubunit Na+/H+ antiporter MnhD subunit